MDDSWKLDIALPEGWRCLHAELEKPYFKELREFLKSEAQKETILPPSSQVFRALETTSLADVRVLLLGQDPYHNLGQAHGLCFSVLPDVPLPPSLKNIYKELESDLQIPPAEHGYLQSWAEQGVLMLNTVLTVRAHEANSHRKRGWEQLTDTIISYVAAKTQPVVFVLWGKPAQTKKRFIAGDHHVILESPHPSPLSARRGFFGSRPFSRINQALRQAKLDEIDWKLPESFES